MRTFSILAVLSIFCLLSQSTHAATPTAPCPDTGNITTSCFLTHSYVNPITISSDNVTLDCRGHDVANPIPGGTRSGISVGDERTPRRNVYVVNCNVTGWDAGIRVVNATSVTLLDNVVSSNDDGYDINNSKTIYIVGGVAMFNKGDGIDLDGDDYVSISQVGIVRNVDKGITVNTHPGGKGNTRIYVIENRITDNGTGIRLESVSTGIVCGNGFAKNAGGNVVRKQNVIAVTESDTRAVGRFGICTLD